MKNFIKGLKEVKGGGDLLNAQSVIIANYPYAMYGEPNEKTTIEDVEEIAKQRLHNLFRCYRDDELFLQFKTSKEANQHWEQHYKKDFEKYEKLLDACYCIEWTKKHQPRTITEIMNDYRATKKITQKDFDTLKDSGSFNNNELSNIMLGLSVGQ